MPEHRIADPPGCWCRPRIEPCEGGEIIIHNDEAGAALNLDPRLYAEWEVPDDGAGDNEPT